MSALKWNIACLSIIALLATSSVTMVMAGNEKDAGSGQLFEFLDRPAKPEPASTIMGRGDLILAESENLSISGKLTYRRVILGDGSNLLIENCTLDLAGDGNEIPSITGSPDSLIIVNSSITLTGWNGSSRLSNQGANVTMWISVGTTFLMDRSTVVMRAGSGWSPTQPGAKFESDLGSKEFSGGNVTLSIISGNRSDLSINSSKIKLFGGSGGDAPNGISMFTDDFFQSGGYTTGGNVSGWVGSGGGVEFRIDSDSNCVKMNSIHIMMEGGKGGDAGNAGDVKWAGQDTYTKPTSSGGYSSGGWKDGQPYDPGFVSQNVGRGGFVSIELKCKDLLVEDSRFDLGGGMGGISGKGGSPISSEQGSPASATNTLGGGGGGGYAGGYGGYSSLQSWDGGRGGDILDNVGSGGDVSFGINCSNTLWMNSLEIVNQGGYVNSLSRGGSGGGSLAHSLDGGGGGGGGMSGGGGAPAVSLFNPYTGGDNGTVNGNVAWGGGASMKIESAFFMSMNRTDMETRAGLTFDTTGTNGGNGEVGGNSVYAGGPGGKGHDFGTRIGPSSIIYDHPAPYPLHPLDGDILTDLSEPFEWSDLDPGFYSGSDQTIVFRLLSSVDIDDVLQERICSGITTNLLYDVPDGTYYWTIQVQKDDINSTWMYPQKFIIDRTYPVLISGPERLWFTSDDHAPRVKYLENTSGLDPESIECRSGPTGGPYSSWDQVTAEYIGDGIYEIIAEIEPVQMNYSFWVRASDMAGNGPVVSGPFMVGVDGTAPHITELKPSQWSGSEFFIEYTGSDHLSGISEEQWLLIDGPVGHLNLTLDVVELDHGSFISEESISLAQGNYSIELFVKDIAGNVGSSGPISLLIDTTSPMMTSFNPADNAILNDPNPTPSIRILDTLSGPSSIDYHLEGPAGIFDLRYGDLETSVDITIGQPLSEGIYTWTIESRDNAGNVLKAGPFSFTIDLIGPSLKVINTDLAEDIVTISYRDSLTGIGEIEIKCFVPSLEGMTEKWLDRFEPIPGGPVDTFNIDLINGLPEPVSYLSIRGMDIAGNYGSWSDPIRIDSYDTGHRMEMICPDAIRSDEFLMVKVRSPVGIDITTIELIIDDGTGTLSTTGPSDSNILLNSTPFQGSELKVPSFIECSFELPFSEGVINVSTRWKDLFNSPETWISTSSQLLIDPEPPEIKVYNLPFYEMKRVEIPISYHDKHSWVHAFDISIDGSAFIPLNTQNSPSLEIVSGKDPLLILNLTWGTLSEFILKVTDIAGHFSEFSFQTRATRSPIVSIIKDFEGSIEKGQSITFSANGEDPDGDELIYKWFIDGAPAGSGANLTPVLDVGPHLITVNCSDGDLFMEENLQVLVEESKETRDEKGSGQFPIIFASMMIIILVVVIAIGSLLWKKRKESEDDEEDLSWDDDDYEDDEDENVKILSGSSRDRDDGSRCGVCLRPLRNSSNRLKCRCGTEFHRGCATREGECPDCGRELMLKKDL